MPNISPERFSKLRLQSGLSQEAMGGYFGITGKYLGMIERGEKQVDANSSLGLLFQVIEESGPPKTPPPSRDVDPSSNVIGENMDPAGRATGLREDTAIYRTRIRMIPVVGWAHAGQATVYDEIPTALADQVASDCRDAKAFAVRLEGDSMEGEGALSFTAGDVLVAMPSEQPYSGCFVVAKFANDGITFRRLEMQGAKITLVPLNKRYEVTTHTPEEFQWMYPIHGRWTQLWKRGN